MKFYMCVMGLLISSQASAAEIVRYKFPVPDFPISQAVEVPSGYSLVFVSGIGPDGSDVNAAKESQATFGDTKTQTLSVLRKIDATLKTMHLTMKDVVKMQVFLVGDPANGGNIDFSGFMDSYRQFFGTAGRPNLPSRSAIKVAGLALPGWLVEIEVIAARTSN